VVFGLLLRNKLPNWALAASFGLFLGEMAQMASGRRHWFALHLPLGLALCAMLVPLVLWIASDVLLIDNTSAVRDPARKLSVGAE
jgi:hypothetical protein